MVRSAGVPAALQAHPSLARVWREDPEPTTARVIGYSPNLSRADALWLLENRPNRNVQLALAMNPYVDEDVTSVVARTLNKPPLPGRTRSASGAARCPLGDRLRD